MLDETALLACAAYVDLNPIRAALAETIEDSDFTSAQKRCCDLQARHAAVWTARQTRSGKRGSTPKQFAPLFDRLGISVEIWCRLVKDFGRLFSVVAGQPERIDEHRSKDSSRRYRTRRETRELLATA